MTPQTPQPDSGQVRCPDCGAIMRPVTLPKADGTLALECPKCGRRVEEPVK